MPTNVNTGIICNDIPVLYILYMVLIFVEYKTVWSMEYFIIHVILLGTLCRILIHSDKL